MTNPEPYPHLSDQELDELVADWTAEDEAKGMIVTDLGAWESAEYEAWCDERDRRKGAA